MLQSWVFCPGITLYAWATGTLDPHASALWGSLAGLFGVIAFTNFARSLKDGAVSTNAPIFRLNFTLTAALAIVLLGETLTVTKAAALACALAAVWLLLAEPGAGGQGANCEVAHARADRDRGDGLRQSVLQDRPQPGRAAGDHGGGAGLGVLLLGDAVRARARQALAADALRLALLAAGLARAGRRLRAA